MKKALHALLQALAVGGHLVNVNAVPVKYQALVAGVVGVIQMAMALYNQPSIEDASQVKK